LDPGITEGMAVRTVSATAAVALVASLVIAAATHRVDRRDARHIAGTLIGSIEETQCKATDGLGHQARWFAASNHVAKTHTEIRECQRHRVVQLRRAQLNGQVTIRQTEGESMAKLHNQMIVFILAASMITAWEAASSSSAPVTPSTPAVSSPGKPNGRAGQVVGTVVRFTAGSTSVEVTIDKDNPAVRDFLSLLPLTLKLEEFAGREKIGYLPRKLELDGSPGSDPEDGDLIYYVPWGNIGFYYNTAGIGYSDQTIHLGIYKASLDQLKQLEGRPVTVEVAR
jgi:hypothetical protein